MDTIVDPSISAPFEFCCCILLSDCVNTLPCKHLFIFLFINFGFLLKGIAFKRPLRASLFLVFSAWPAVKLCNKSTHIFRNSTKKLLSGSNTSFPYITNDGFYLYETLPCSVWHMPTWCLPLKQHFASILTLIVIFRSPNNKLSVSFLCMHQRSC